MSLKCLKCGRKVKSEFRHADDSGGHFSSYGCCDDGVVERTTFACGMCHECFDDAVAAQACLTACLAGQPSFEIGDTVEWRMCVGSDRDGGHYADLRGQIVATKGALTNLRYLVQLKDGSSMWVGCREAKRVGGGKKKRG